MLRVPWGTSWLGSLVSNKHDGSGLVYMRNRYLNPQTGQFTQTDPIGLAGGLNLYGYAGGDPVNFSDPFGLTPVPLACLAAPAACAALAAGAVRVGSLAARTHAAQRAAQAASARSHQLGREGEAFVSRAIGLGRNTTERLGIRIPDFVDRAGNVFHEAKNAQRIGLSPQIREMIGNLQEGQKLIIHVRVGTRVSRHLDPYIERGLVQIVRAIPAAR
jgi:RHS repeat-associated protein